MEKQQLTAGEFAKLSGTTKRTIIWYHKTGILIPDFIDTSGYRYYTSQQILHFQTILLLRKLHFSLEEIKTYLDNGKSLQDMFYAKRYAIQEEINYLQQTADTLDEYYTNFQKQKILIHPDVVTVKPFEIYYIEKIGSYSKIEEYIAQLANCFTTIPKSPTFLTIFLEEGYKPAKSKMKIGIIAKRNLQLKKMAKSIVHKETVVGYKALSYRHEGSGNVLSLFWKELEKYADANKFEWKDTRLSFADIEYYHHTKQGIVFEIHRPIK